MKLTLLFEAPWRQRILRNRFIGITTFSIREEGDKYHPLWWDGKCWSENPNGAASSHAPCRSYRAFRRHLKKHQESLKGYEVVLVNRYIGHNISAFL